MTKPADQPRARPGEDGDLLDRVGQLTRTLHESMRELGLQPEVRKAAEAIPGARDRLSYIADTTEEAAAKAMSSVEAAQPLQQEVERRARALDNRWQQWFHAPMDLADARALVQDTRSYLQWIPEQTQATNVQLTEIMMAQDFQDLTGQVITKIMTVIQDIEQQLVQALLDNMPADRKRRASGKKTVAESLVNGPQIKPDGQDDVVSTQGQVDDLLESLGF